MGKYEKLRSRILIGSSDANIGFDDLRQLLKQFGFAEKIKGSHHIFTKTDVAEILNLQPKGASAKAYQVKQVRNLIRKYRLGEDDDD